jgi:CRP-like cAMP-binding protein
MFARFAKGEFIFREGDAANRFYLIRAGSVSLETRKETGPVTVQVIGAGDVLGWSWLFPPYFWRYDARALEDVEAIFIYGTQLRDLAEKDHDVGYELYRRTSMIVTQRLQATRRSLTEKANN